MKVILDVTKKSCIKNGVQYCSTPGGFASIKKMHPEDEFIIEDALSFDAWNDYLIEMSMKQVYDFCDEMCITPEDFTAMLQWNSCKMNFLAPEYEMEKDALYDAYCDAWENYYNG